MKRPPYISSDAVPAAKEIHRRMVEAGLTTAELTRRADVGRSYIKDLFSGTKSRRPTADNLAKVASALGCSLSDLINDPGRSVSDKPQQERINPGSEFPVLLESEQAMLRLWARLSPTAKHLIILAMEELLAENRDRRKL
jgi:transcriptional regulator with XRE-family HTH domain